MRKSTLITSILILFISLSGAIGCILYATHLSRLRAMQRNTVSEPVGAISCPCRLELYDQNNTASKLALVSPSGTVYMPETDSTAVIVDTTETGVWYARYEIRNDEQAQLVFKSSPSMTLMLQNIILDWNTDDPVLSFFPGYGTSDISGFQIKCFVNLENSEHKLQTVWQGTLEINKQAELHLDLSDIEPDDNYHLSLTTYNANDLQDDSMRTLYQHERRLSYGKTRGEN